MSTEKVGRIPARDTSKTRHHADRSSGERVQPGVARNLAELARHLRAESTMDSLLAEIAEAATREVDAAHWACISEIVGRRVLVRAATGQMVQRVEQQQIRTGDGPCLTSLRDQITVRSDDLAEDGRWPAFGRAAVAEGVRSMLAVQLFVHDDNLGALNVYSPERAAFDEEDETTAILLAAHAAVAMKGTRVETNLRTALESRDIIGQAKGVLIERYKIDSNAAFELLVQVSQRTHRKLREVCDELVSTGEFTLD